MGVITKAISQSAESEKEVRVRGDRDAAVKLHSLCAAVGRGAAPHETRFSGRLDGREWRILLIETHPNQFGFPGADRRGCEAYIVESEVAL